MPLDMPQNHTSFGVEAMNKAFKNSGECTALVGDFPPEQREEVLREFLSSVASAYWADHIKSRR